jgi:hypothetical protein
VNEEHLQTHLLNLIIDARRMTPEISCGVPGFGNKNELSLDAFLVEAPACDDVIGAPNSAESLKWVLVEMDKMRAMLQQCNALEEKERPTSKRSKRAKNNVKKKQEILPADLEQSDDASKTVPHIDLAYVQAEVKKKATFEKKLMEAAGRMRALFAHVGIAQDRVAVSTLVGGQVFVRDGWAGGHKGSSRPDNFPPTC